MIHTVRTEFGDSDITYGGENLGNWENSPKASYKETQVDLQSGLF